MAVRAYLFKIDGRVLGGMQFGGAGAELGVTVQAHYCILTVGCKGACSLGCWCRGILGCCLGCGCVFGGVLFGVLLG